MKEIESAGKVYPVKYGMAALSEFLDSEGLALSDMENIGKNMSLTTALKLVYFGLKHGAREAGKDFAFTLDDIGDLFYELNQFSYLLISNIFIPCRKSFDPS